MTDFFGHICFLIKRSIFYAWHFGYNHILYPAYASAKCYEEILNVVKAVHARSKQEGVRYLDRTDFGRPGNTVTSVPSFNLISAMHHCCSEPAVTYESNQGLIEHRDPVYDYEEIYKAHIILFTETIREQLKRYNKI